MKKVIFACVHNAGRSQMAAALFNQMARPGVAQAISAGTQPALHVHPPVVEVMKECGVDLSQARPQQLTQELAAGVDMLITMGCGEACPVVPGVQVVDWPLRDPKGASVDDVRVIRDDIRQRVRELVEAQGW